MQTNAVRSTKVPLIRKAERGATERRVVGGNAECGPSSSSASETSENREVSSDFTFL